jgi:hypothetical protein
MPVFDRSARGCGPGGYYRGPAGGPRGAERSGSEPSRTAGAARTPAEALRAGVSPGGAARYRTATPYEEGERPVGHSPHCRRYRRRPSRSISDR